MFMDLFLAVLIIVAHLLQAWYNHRLNKDGDGDVQAMIDLAITRQDDRIQKRLERASADKPATALRQAGDFQSASGQPARKFRKEL